MTTTLDRGPLDGPQIDLTQTDPVPFGRLVGVELRKMTDTRAGRWLLGVTYGLVLAGMAVALLVVLLNDLSMSFATWLQVLPIPVSLLLPVVAITSITQEWGQRTGLVTFGLEPHRARVVLAKLASVSVLAVATLLLAMACAVLGNLLFDLFSSSAADWEVPWSEVGWTVLVQVAYFVMAFGFGMVFLSTPVAIVLYYVVSLLLPMMVYGPVYALVSWGPDVLPWLDLGLATTPYVTEGVPAPDEAPWQVAVTTLVWVVLPFVAGLQRVRRVELK